MTALLELNKSLLIGRSDLLSAIESDAIAAFSATQSASAAPPAASPSLVEGLLVRVTLPKREWERLVVSVIPYVAVGASPTAHVDAHTERGRAIAQKTLELRSSIEKGTVTAFYRVGVLKSVVFHTATAGQAPTPYFLVDLGDCQETFTQKQIAEQPLHERTDDELSMLLSLCTLFSKPTHSMELHRVLATTLQRIRQRSGVASSASAPGHFTFSSSSSGLNAPKTTSSGAEVDGNAAALLAQQRELIQQLKHDVEQKNKDLYQMTLQMRAHKAKSDEDAAALHSQIQTLSDLHTKTLKSQEEREAKLRPLIETVRPLHGLLKLAREKLGMPQGSLEAIERALREATVVPRGGNATPT